MYKFYSDRNLELPLAAIRAKNKISQIKVTYKHPKEEFVQIRGNKKAALNLRTAYHLYLFISQWTD
ncbi:hypothetical protein CFS9_27100 [Flavobacterium sp. CFS9]|uniref:Uncharacterized protein n=1 Tax=Flavobacterium sp. CFS9 TaxID=3143118 RepID=A0AAT9H2X5_9FLAO